MSLEEFVHWNLRDEMVSIMAEVKLLDPDGKMPHDIAVKMLVEQQEKHDWVGRLDPEKERKQATKRITRGLLGR